MDYDRIRCPFCGSRNLEFSKEDFNHRAAFWGTLFLSLWGILFGLFCRKRTYCNCRDCGSGFAFYEQ